MIITVGGQKGGCGKTTIAAELAINLSTKGRLLFVDADPQASATIFCNATREEKEDIEFTAIQLLGKAVRSEVLKLKVNYDFIVIDAGGYDASGQRYALSVSDIYLACFKPESLALWTLENVEKMVDEMSTANPTLKSRSLLNIGWSSGIDNEESAQILIESDIIAHCPHVIQRRKAFCDATGKGLSVSERLPKDDKAIEEVNTLISFVEDLYATT